MISMRDVKVCLLGLRLRPSRGWDPTDDNIVDIWNLIPPLSTSLFRSLAFFVDSGVGKTSVVQRFVWDSFRDGQEHTIGASFMSKTLTFGNSSFRFQIWDTAGQEKYRTLAPMYYRGAAAAIIVYDITSKESFSNVKSWVRELEQQGPRDIVLAIAGNKKDLQEDREVDGDEAANYAKEVGAVFTETSALTAENVNELFQDIVKKLPKESEPLDRSNGTSKGKVRLHKADNQKQKKCC